GKLIDIACALPKSICDSETVAAGQTRVGSGGGCSNRWAAGDRASGFILRSMFERVMEGTTCLVYYKYHFAQDSMDFGIVKHQFGLFSMQRLGSIVVDES